MKEYNPAKIRDVVLGRVKEQKAKETFVSSFARDEAGNIPKEVFYDVLTDLSNSVASDDNFVQMISGCFGTNEDKNSSLDQESLKSIVKQLRFKLITLTTGSHDEYIMRKTFNEFDLDRSGVLTVDELRAMVTRLEMPLAEKYLQELFRMLDRNQSGGIEYEEFNHYILYDPFR